MKKILFILLALFLSAPSFAQEKISIQHGPYLQNLRETEVTIVWKANLPSVGWVELAPDDNADFYAQSHPKYFDTETGIKKISQLHAVKITGLKPGTRYRYRVFAQEVLQYVGNHVYYGRTTGTVVYKQNPLTFTTNDTSRNRYSFAMINDIHGRTADIPALMNVAGYKNMDFVIFNGDMISILKDEESMFKAFLDTSVYVFAKEKPMYYARGNHETRGEFAPHLHEYFSPKEPQLYYTFRQGSVCYIVLDSGEDKPDSDIEYYGITDFDQYRTEEAQWLEKALQSDECKNALWKVVICHMPPYSDEEIWHGQIDVMQKFVPLLNKAGVDVMLAGHVHRYVYMKPSSEVHFPVVINSLDTVLKGFVNGNTLKIEVLDKTGKNVDTKTYTK